MSAKEDCYRLIQEIAVAQNPFCRAPGCENPSTCGHHLFKRDKMATAFDPRYVWGVCLGCHGWAHRQPEQFREWAISIMGEEEYYAALRMSNSIVKYLDFNEIRRGLKMALDKIHSP
jgi:hypothetical protein